MIRLDAALAKESLQARLVLQVHDELVLEAPDAEVATVTAAADKVLRDILEPSAALNPW